MNLYAVALSLVELDGAIDDVGVIFDTPFFVVRYTNFNMPSELRRANDGALVAKLNGQYDGATLIPNSPFFIVEYAESQTSNELRWTNTGEVVTDEGGRQTALSAVVLEADKGYYWLDYQDGTGALVSTTGTLVDFGRGAKQVLYFPETNRVALLNLDGRVDYIDLNLIEDLGGADAAETLAAMSLEELIAFTCATLFTDNPEWDEARLDEYLALLPDGTPQACQQ